MKINKYSFILRSILVVLVIAVTVSACNIPAPSAPPPTPYLPGEAENGTPVQPDSRIPAAIAQAPGVNESTGKTPAPIDWSPALASGTWKPLPLRYDYLNTEEDLFEQVAIGHSSSIIMDVTAPIPPSSRINSPLIILPCKQGMVTLHEDYSGAIRPVAVEYAYFNDYIADSLLLKEPGWGLMTTFSPTKLPYKIDTIRIAAAAFCNERPADFILRILDRNGQQLWSVLGPWYFFYNSDTAHSCPIALWRDFNIGGIITDDVFSIELLSESTLSMIARQGAGRPKSGQYVALVYEKITDPGIPAHSCISYNGVKADPRIELYTPIGDPVNFNLCIRVEGSYLEK
ncbi:MAG: hypothetical protein PHO26_02500 [Dehalococcoidia bacterium]|nr:hypothetical protein [Dehalococcoidia bacterium]MDD5494154.1 hypothetical protein [Dehalococcoidia bacterium]